jgi:streptogramin lyase
MNRRIHHLLAAAVIAAAALLLPGSVHAIAQTAPQFLGSWSTTDSPYTVAVNPQGDVWVAFADTPRIARFDTAGHQQVSIPLDPSDRPLAIATDSAGNAYVSDNNNSTVLKYTRAGALAATWSNVVEAPNGIAVDSSGDVFVVDGDFNDVVELSSAGTMIRRFGANGVGTPSGLAVDAAGNVYVTDNDADQIHKLSPTGASLGTFGAGFGSGQGQFDLPAYDAIDSGGNIFVTDENNNRIQELTPAGTYLNAWGSGGAGDGEFTNPLGIAVDVAGNVYVADEGNARIEKFFAGLDPCFNLFGTHVSACQAAKAVCMAQLAPQDEASCLNAAKTQYDPFRGQRPADHATATGKPKEAATSGHIVVQVHLTAAGAAAAGRKVHLTLSGGRIGLSHLHIAPASATTSGAGLATFTVTTTQLGAGAYHVAVVDVTDGKTFSNLATIRFA